jgi:hypothetical protein
MKNAELSKALRDKAEALMETDSTAGELINVLARVVEGKELIKSFGAPGDWGYNTPHR